MRLLITRPEPDNARTAAALRALGHEVVLAPMLWIEAVADVDFGPPPFAAVLLTSANGAHALAQHPRRGELVALPALAVGRSTADAARAAGFADVTSADGSASDLARLAAARLAGARLPLLYLAGEDRTADLGAELSAQGLAVRTVVAYRAAKTGEFPPLVCAALEQGGIDGVLHFSRRSVEAYLECSRAIIAPSLAPVHYCLSARAAEPLRLAGARQIRIAARPDEASLLDLVAPKAMPKPGSNRLE